ncbi:UNKNOWN [Stylonychia lemnae]|uniref:Cyclin N-terminal domain-containing protein n=1 Tax=Stylonychia lemnae TaxID=5949 RepID=A0A078AR10_STYLE|nr:UNKNOWN [Stylonychia lemnae]|eukprot:CDW83318.1 UNKNOWN [Stylonychia lemnae]
MRLLQLPIENKHNTQLTSCSHSDSSLKSKINILQNIPSQFQSEIDLAQQFDAKLEVKSESKKISKEAQRSSIKKKLRQFIKIQLSKRLASMRRCPSSTTSMDTEDTYSSNSLNMDHQSQFLPSILNDLVVMNAITIKNFNESQAKQVMIDAVLRIFKSYSITLPTLFLIIQNIHRYLQSIKTQLCWDINIKTIEDFRLSALIILNLSTKYSDRVAFKITDLAKKLNLYNFPGGQFPSAEELRMSECMIMKSLDFKIGAGQASIFDYIIQTLKRFEHYSTVKGQVFETRQISSLKAKAINVALHYLKNLDVTQQIANESVACSALFLAIKLEEKKSGVLMVNTEVFQLLMPENSRPENSFLFAQITKEMLQIVQDISKQEQ